MHSRREFLLGGGTALVTAVAGCLHSSEATDASDPDPVDWFPASITDYQQPYVGYAHLADALEVEAFANTTWGDPILGVDPSTVDAFIYGGSAEPEYRLDAFVGDFDAETIRKTTEDQRGITLESAGQYGAFDRYEYPDSEQVLGLQEGIAIDAEAELFEAVIDARAGDGDRLIDEHDDFATLVDSTEDFHFFQSNIGWSWEDAATVAGETRDIDAEETELTRRAVYPSEGDASAARDGRREEAVDEHYLSDVDVTVDGRMLVLSGMADTAELFGP